jgi:exodeoxyribonuclease V gamma subunit
LSQLSAGKRQLVDCLVDHFPENLLGKIQSDIFYLAEPIAAQYELAAG